MSGIKLVSQQQTCSNQLERQRVKDIKDIKNLKFSTNHRMVCARVEMKRRYHCAAYFTLRVENMDADQFQLQIINRIETADLNSEKGAQELYNVRTVHSTKPQRCTKDQK